jgi:hypothetical protein
MSTITMASIREKLGMKPERKSLRNMLTGKSFSVFIEDDGKQVQFMATVVESGQIVSGGDVMHLVRFHRQPEAAQ